MVLSNINLIIYSYLPRNKFWGGWETEDKGRGNIALVVGLVTLKQK